MPITVYDFCDMCVDSDLITVNLWDSDAEKVIFTGTMTEAMESEFSDYTVNSFDAELQNDEITLNVER